VTVGAARTKTGCLGTGGRLRALSPFAAASLATRTAVVATAAVATATAALATATATLAIPASTTVAIATSTATVTITATPATLRCEHLGDERFVAARTEQLELLGLLAGPLRREHGRDLETLEVRLSFDFHDVAHTEAARYQRSVDHALRLLRPGGTPSPGAVVAI